MKILHITQSAGYGVTIYVNSLIRGLKEYGCEQVLLGSEYYDTEEYKALLDKLYIIPMKREVTINDVGIILKCRKIVRQVKPNIVYCHSSKAGIYGRFACLGLGVKVIYNPHGWAFNMHCSKIKQCIYKAFEIVMATITDVIITISKYEKNSTPYLIPSHKVITIINGVNVKSNLKILSDSNIKRGDLGIPDDAFVVGMVARISIQKGQDMFVKAAQLLVKKIPNVFFINVGGKSDDIPLEDIINDAGLQDRFIITNEVPDAIKYIKLFDVAVLTSRWEGFGLVLPEYMLAEKPIVAFDVDAVSESVKENINGLLVEPENISILAESIYKLYVEPQRRLNYGRTGRTIAEKKFDINRVVKMHLKLFESFRINNK